MSIGQLNIYGKDKVQVAIERIKAFEPEDGYFLAFSGGKDSVVVKALADMAEVKYDAHYNLTTVDPPELVQFIKREYPDVIFEKQHWKHDGVFVKAGDPVTMWNLIPEKLLPPTRVARYCCQHLKEQTGIGRFVITGVRWAESVNRAKKRAGLEIADGKTTQREHSDPDNPDQELIHICMQKTQKILNPIIDWTEYEVWEFIKTYNVAYCKLYDEGFPRLGCIGCPMAGKHRVEEFERWPKVKQAYLRAFERMLKAKDIKGSPNPEWKTGEDVYKWWIGQY